MSSADSNLVNVRPQYVFETPESLYLHYGAGTTGPFITKDREVRKCHEGLHWVVFEDHFELQLLSELLGKELPTSRWGMEDDYDNCILLAELMIAFGKLPDGYIVLKDGMFGEYTTIRDNKLGDIVSPSSGCNSLYEAQWVAWTDALLRGRSGCEL